MIITRVLITVGTLLLAATLAVPSFARQDGPEKHGCKRPHYRMSALPSCGAYNACSWS
jgi:hypothetical protein